MVVQMKKMIAFGGLMTKVLTRVYLAVPGPQYRFGLMIEVATPKPDDPFSGHCDLQTQKTTTIFLFITIPRFLAQILPNL